MSKFRNPVLDKLWEEQAEMYKTDPRAAKWAESYLIVLCDFDMRLAKLEGVDLITGEPNQPHHPK